jgi:hypothetical protein
MKKKELDWIDRIFPPHPTTWEVFRDYVNEKDVGNIITRKEYIKKLDRNHLTLSMYQKVLKNTGYLRYIKPGSYELMKKVPEISLYKLYKLK